MKLFMIRHGATAGNLEKRYVGRTDEGLTEQAVFFLQEEALKLRELAGNVAAIITSPMKRCLETAEILFPEKLYEHVPRIQKAGLSECDFGTLSIRIIWNFPGMRSISILSTRWGERDFPAGRPRRHLKPGQWRHFRKYGRKFLLRLNRGLTGHSFLSFMEERSWQSWRHFRRKRKVTMTGRLGTGKAFWEKWMRQMDRSATRGSLKLNDR